MRRALLKLLAAGPLLGPSGDGLTRPANAPPAISPSYGTQPGTSQTVVLANRVIIFGPSGTVTGLFVYQPGTTPGPGNPPIASITNAATDPYGNPVQTGITAYQAGGTGAFAQLINQALRLHDSAANLWTVVADTLGPSIQVATPGGNALYIGNDGSLYAALPGNPGSIESWHSMTLLNSWANAAGNTAARYRRVASPPNSVQVQAVLSATAATSSTFFTLPAGYVPSGTGGFAVGANGSVSANQAPQLRWDASGNLSIASFTAPAAFAVWVGGFVNLDA